MSLVVTYFCFLATPYVVAVVLPNWRWLIAYGLLAFSMIGWALYKVGRRAVPEGMTGSVLNIPEAQETLAALGICLALGVIFRGITLYLRESGLPRLGMVIIHLIGLPLIFFSFQVARGLGRSFDVNLG
jgi:hypothetical protein